MEFKETFLVIFISMMAMLGWLIFSLNKETEKTTRYLVENTYCILPKKLEEVF